MRISWEITKQQYDICRGLRNRLNNRLTINMGIYNQCFLEEYLRMATIEKQQNAD